MSVELSPFGWAFRPIQRYADFTGRAPRAEYWWYVLATMVVGIAVGFIDGVVGAPIVGDLGPATLLFDLILFVPGLAVVVRRLHDIDRSGWWALLSASSYAFLVVPLTSTNPDEPFGALQAMGVGPLIAIFGAWLIGAVVLLVFMITRGDEGANNYGPDPYDRGQLEEIFA